MSENVHAVRAIRAVIVDDEPAGRDAVQTLLASHADIVVVGLATNGREAVEVIRRENPDLVFLDVQMPDLDGFGVLGALGDSVPTGIIFVTAHDEHALRAFDVHALDYILKPFGKPRFDTAVQRASDRLNSFNALSLQRTLASMAFDRLVANGAPGVAASHANRRIAVRNGARTVLIPLADIDWVEAAGDYARIHAGDASHLVSQSMNTLESSLLDPSRFLRIHRSVIVQLDRICEMQRDPDGGGIVVLHDTLRLRVSRGRWDRLQDAVSRCHSATSDPA